MFCCTFLNVHSSFAIILMGKRKLVALLSLSSWCIVVVVWLFLAVPWVCLQFVNVVFPDHTHLLFLVIQGIKQLRLSNFAGIPLNRPAFFPLISYVLITFTNILIKLISC